MICRPLALLIFALAFGSVVNPRPASAQERVRRNLEIEWEPVEDASMYELQVRRKNDPNAKPTRFKTKDPNWSAVIKPGIYATQIRSLDARGVPGEWSPPADVQVKLPAIIVINPEPGQALIARDQDKQEVELRWEPVPGAATYSVELQSTTSDWRKVESVSEPSFKADLPVGEDYTWNVAAVDANGESGDISEQPYAFQMRGPPLAKPKIDKPLSKFVKELTWASPDKTSHYSYDLSYRNPKTRKWEFVEAEAEYLENKLAFDLTRPPGKYRLSVQAHGRRREPSPAVQLDFEAKGGFKNEKDFDNAILRDSLNKPTNCYAIVSYLITNISYRAAAYHENNRPTFEALGGTGRLGAGYQDPESKWGGFFIVDYSGFVIERQNIRFASAEAHMTRKLEFGQGGLLQLAGGVFSKELPIVQGNELEGFRGIGTVRNIGPHLGLQYWMPFSQRLGLQMNARIYYSAMGSVSNGETVKNAMSYQYGALGSYRLNANWMAYAGYVHRTDEARYTSPQGPGSWARPGQVNSITIEGDYLNLILEYSF